MKSWKEFAKYNEEITKYSTYRKPEDKPQEIVAFTYRSLPKDHNFKYLSAKEIERYNQNLPKNEGLNLPTEEIERYIVGLGNRLRLIQPEEVEMFRHKLTELRNQIDGILNK